MDYRSIIKKLSVYDPNTPVARGPKILASDPNLLVDGEPIYAMLLSVEAKMEDDSFDHEFGTTELTYIEPTSWEIEYEDEDGELFILEDFPPAEQEWLREWEYDFVKDWLNSREGGIWFENNYGPDYWDEDGY